MQIRQRSLTYNQKRILFILSYQRSNKSDWQNIKQTISELSLNKKIGQILRNSKDRRPLFHRNVQNILFLRASIYWRNRKNVNLWIKEHQCVRLKHVIQSALSKHNETGHQILFDKTTTIITITNISSYFSRKYREAIEIQKYPNDLNRNLNRDNGYINKIWKTILPVIEN